MLTSDSRMCLHKGGHCWAQHHGKGVWSGHGLRLTPPLVASGHLSFLVSKSVCVHTFRTIRKTLPRLEPFSAVGLFHHEHVSFQCYCVTMTIACQLMAKGPFPVRREKSVGRLVLSLCVSLEFPPGGSDQGARICKCSLFWPSNWHAYLIQL